jgi:xanthine dehydrogenase YagS FAD-binding subunit
MKSFAYKVAASEAEAAQLLGDKAVALAGGTSLLNLMKSYVVQPETVVSITRISGLEQVEAAGAGHRIGANVRLGDLAAHPDIQKAYPALAQAAANVASPQIQHMGTVGGNLCQRPNCWYFTQEIFDCLKRGGSTCPAKEGENEFHAILGNDGPCVHAHPSSLAPALIALAAKVRIAGPGGAREVSLDEFFVGPGTNIARETILAPNEIVTHVLLGEPSPLSATYEVRQKASNDWPLAIASVALRLEGASCVAARICLGAVAPVPWRAAGAEDALKGKPVTAESAQAAAEAALAGATPLAQNAYKVQSAKAAVRRAILAAASAKTA